MLCLNGKSDCVSFCREPLMTSWHMQRKPKVLTLFGPSETLQSPLLSVSPSLPLFQLCWLVPIVELCTSSFLCLKCSSPQDLCMTSSVSEPQLKSHPLRPFLINYLSLHSPPMDIVSYIVYCNRQCSYFPHSSYLDYKGLCLCVSCVSPTRK